MAYDLSGQHITLTAQDMTHGIKSAVVNAQLRIEELKSGQDGLNDAVEVALNNVDGRLNALMGGETTLTADVAQGGTVITVANPEMATVGAKLEIGSDETVYEITDKAENGDITVDPAMVVAHTSGETVTIASTADVTDLQEKMNILADIFSKDGTANDVFDALAILANAWNEAGDMITTKEVTFNSASGEATVDLSAFNFTATSDYKLIGSTDGKGAMVARVGFVKSSETLASVIAYDAKYFVEDQVKYDASVTDGSFLITVGVTYARPVLSFSITDEEGNTTSV